MASTTETGHAKNVAHFDTLINFCTAYGDAFNPSKESIKLAALNKLHDDARCFSQAAAYFVRYTWRKLFQASDCFRNPKVFIG